MKCSSCGRFHKGEQAPRGWKVCGRLAICQRCRRGQFRLRSLTMAVAEPIGAAWHELSVALEKSWNQAMPCLIHNQAWKATIAEGQPAVRISIADRWWTLRLNDAEWSGGRRNTYQKIASGKAVAGDLAISPGQSHDRIVCKTVAWLPREQEVDGSPLWVAAKRLRPGIRAQSIEQIPNPDLRRAIRANWVSFPSQVPTFPSCTGHEQQRKVAQLYFVLGWSVTSIAGRYAMSRQQVRGVLDAWKLRAARAGYIQHIQPLVALDCGDPPEAHPGGQPHRRSAAR